MKHRIYITIFLLFAFLGQAMAQGLEHPKREFRGAWLNTVGQERYMAMNQEEMQRYFVETLDNLQRMGINAVIFQVRPCADAFYPSTLEPWSKYLTGKQGVAPSPEWDPLQYLIEQCHQRNMELHAWLNPYRVATQAGDSLAPSHIYHKHPEWFVQYGRQLYFDPGLPESRQFIGEVVADMVTRYDIDAIHMDDYFYPYPIAGSEFPDEASYSRYNKGLSRDDWRRDNVNRLIEELHHIIKERKPWVRFGISPFGIYRNSKNDPEGSATNGLQNYDELYADVLLWSRKGWVDYMMPQLYWEIGHKAACVETLAYWWNQHGYGRHLYFGQDVERTMNANGLNPRYTQLNHKMQLSRYLDHVGGNCFWPGYSLLNNYKGIADDLESHYHARPALIPAYTFIDNQAPAEVKGLKARWTPNGYELQWKRKETTDEMQRQLYFCVYRFNPDEIIDLHSTAHLIAITRETTLLLPYKKGTQEYVYVVTAVDRMHNESQGKARKVKL